MTAKTAIKSKQPKLKNLDDLFMLNGNIDQSENMEDEKPAFSEKRHKIIAINRLVSFPDHPFLLYQGERLEDMINSIKEHGIIAPIIVRNVNNSLQILSGHNRVNAAKNAGLDKVPAIILDSITDDDAWAYVVESNLMQRSFSDMSHSEKAAVIAVHHSKLFSQGKRNDILKALQKLDNPVQAEDGATYSQVANKLTSISKVGEKYSLSKDTAARYLRINRLIPPLKKQLDDGVFAFMAAVIIASLNESEQEQLSAVFENTKMTMSMKNAETFVTYSEKGLLDENTMIAILTGTLPIKKKTASVSVIKMQTSVYQKYFREKQEENEIQEIIEEALKLYFSKT